MHRGGGGPQPITALWNVLRRNLEQRVTPVSVPSTAGTRAAKRHGSTEHRSPRHRHRQQVQSTVEAFSSPTAVSRGPLDGLQDGCWGFCWLERMHALLSSTLMFGLLHLAAPILQDPLQDIDQLRSAVSLWPHFQQCLDATQAKGGNESTYPEAKMPPSDGPKSEAV